MKTKLSPIVKTFTNFASIAIFATIATLATLSSCQKSKIEVDKTAFYFSLEQQYGKEYLQITTNGEWWIESDNHRSRPMLTQAFFVSGDNISGTSCYTKKKYKGDAKVAIMYQINLDFPDEAQNGWFYIKNEEKTIKVDVYFR